ncbi:MAG: hypothetical protein IOMNBAOH_00524 [Rhodocyclaceae bacterium]|nr:hypothetical protein [Rhodocyclaceae bacterium]
MTQSKTHSFLRSRKCLFPLILLATVSGFAHAEIKWSLLSGNQTGSSGGSNPGNTLSYAGNINPTTTATASAYANTVGNTNTSLESAYLFSYSGGLGVRNQDYSSRSGQTIDTGENQSPEHAMDNQGRKDMILLSFTDGANPTDIKLTGAEIGWMSTDSDITVLAWTGIGTPAMSGVQNDLTASGWTLVGHYANLALDTKKTVNVNRDVYSSYWLISAYLGTGLTGTGASGSLDTCPTGCTTGNDYVKLSAVYGERRPAGNSGVPAPGTLALAAVALSGVWGMRRRRRH